ncbi:MAG: DUF503 domain-containing protein [Phycisphaerae bacterium]|jgi:uncharacterized protein YlxP (DUF503 family)|nr:DUF503 domain-containing protein [Phycisphaerae bacterium]
MIVGIMQVELMIYDAMTLKDKRRVVKSIKDRVAHEFNVSIAEVDALEIRRKAILGISMVGNDGKFVRECLDKVLNLIRDCRGATLVDYQMDFV